MDTPGFYRRSHGFVADKPIYPRFRFQTTVNTLVYCSDTSPLDDPTAYREAYARMPAYRLAKIDSLASPEDRKRSMGAELLLRRALSDIGIKEYDVEYGENGKPFLADSEIYFNLSHSGTKVLCCLSDVDVGCDVERIRSINLAMARKHFHPSEYRVIESLEGDDRYDMFFRLWTLKESFMKATGLGLGLPLDSFRIVLDDGISVVQRVDDREYRFREFRLEDGYRCACCSLNYIENMKTVDLI